MEGVCWGDVTRKSQGMTCWGFRMSIKNQGPKSSHDSLGNNANRESRVKTPLGNIKGFVGLSGDYDMGVKGFACLDEDSAGDLRVALQK